MSYKCSSLNGPGTATPLSHPILKLDESPLPIISQEFAFQYESEKVENFLEQNGLDELQMLQFEWPQH